MLTPSPCAITLVRESIISRGPFPLVDPQAQGAGRRVLETVPPPAAVLRSRPYFSAFQGTRSASSSGGKGCMWGLGGRLPGATTDFGKNAQYGSPLTTTYLAFGGGGSTIDRINNFRQIVANPCPR
jgi:hypothetical protein